MKICVYAICKNEMKFLDKWLDNMSEADYIVVLDTGSTDGSYEFLQKDKRVTLTRQKIIDPWRFDVARNESLRLIPEDADVCVCTDPDELFEPGWAKVIRDNWKVGETTRGKYNYAWSHNDAGEPIFIFAYNKMHANHKYHWRYPCHEVVVPNDPKMEEKILEFGDTIYLHHYQDTSKDRSNYLDLLEIARKERPDNLYIQMLYARELIIWHHTEEGLEVYLDLLNNPKIDGPDVDLVLRDSLLVVAKTYIDLDNLTEAEWYLKEFLRVDSTYREPYLLLAEIYYQQNVFTLAQSCIEAAKKYSFRHLNWVEHSFAYSGWLEELQEKVKKAIENNV